MIMARNEDGTYSQVGFVKDNVGIDTEYIYDKDGDIVFEKGFTRETSGTVPLTINGIGKDLKDWSITGNTVQNGTPTPDTPQEVKAVGDKTGNLFDTTNEVNEKYLLIDGSIAQAQSYSMTDYIPINGGTKYTISAVTNQSSAAYHCFYTEDRMFISSINCSIAKTTFTAPTDAKYIRCSYRIISNPNIMLNEGIKLLPYEPYGYKIPVVTSADGTEPITTPIYLPTPLYSGEVMRSDGSRELKWRKLVLTGKEAVVKNNNDSTNYLYYIALSNNKKINGFCSHLIGRSGAPISSIGFNMTSAFPVLYLNFGADIMKAQSSGNTVKGFKEYLATQYAAGTPVTIWYQLAEPTTETFTAPQIPTLNGTTVIDVDTAVKPTEMYIKYKSSK